MNRLSIKETYPSPYRITMPVGVTAMAEEFKLFTKPYAGSLPKTKIENLLEFYCTV